MADVTRRQALGALTLPVLASTATGVAAADAQPPADGVPKPAFSLLLVNDIYRMRAENGRGGFAKLAAVVKAERARGVPVLFCHAGDTFSPSLFSGFDHGAHIVELTNMVAPDVFVPGNHEFDFGKEVYFQRISEAKFPVFAANMRAADGTRLPLHHDRRVIELGGVKVGVLGIALAETPRQSNPGDLRFLPVMETLREQVELLRREGAEFLVAVTHTDFEMDLRILNSHLVDVLLTGHDHDLRVEYDDRSAMVESSHDADYVTSVDIYVDRPAGGEQSTLRWTPGFRIHDTLTIAPDPAMEARIAAYESEVSKELSVPLAKLATPLDSRAALVRYREAAIGDLIADAMRAATGAQVAIINGGGIRGNRIYPAGTELTRGDVLTELPFGNKSIVVTVTGRTLRAALENGFSKLDARAGRFPQVSGLTVEVDMTRPVGERIVALDVAGRPVEPEATYSVVTNDYMLRGGDGYGMLGRDLGSTADMGNRLLANDVMAYLRHLGTVDIKPQNRIVIRP